MEKHGNMINIKEGQFELLKTIITVNNLFFLCVPLEPNLTLLSKHFSEYF